MNDEPQSERNIERVREEKFRSHVRGERWDFNAVKQNEEDERENSRSNWPQFSPLDLSLVIRLQGQVFL